METIGEGPIAPTHAHPPSLRSRLLRLLLLLVVAGVLAPAAAQAAPDPLTCTGYPEARVFVEAQSWWKTTPGAAGTDQGHGHLGACVPQDQTLTGNVHVDFIAKLHNNPGYIKDIIAEAATDVLSTNGTQTLFKTSTTSYSCPTGDCTFVIPTDFNTSAVTVDGLEQLKIRMRIKEPDGNTMRPSLRFIANLRNGHPVDDYYSRNLSAYGWYGSSADSSKGPLYAYATWNSPVPAAPVKGTWTFSASFTGDRARISDNVTGYLISVDPAFHAAQPSEGTVFYRGTTICPLFGRGCDGPVKQVFSIDTTRLANGPHKLFLRTDENDSIGSTNSGALAIPFQVAN